MTPSLDQITALPATVEQSVPESAIDENGHMNITDYFSVGAWGLWQGMKHDGMGEDYIGERGLSFFTVEHHLRYLAEMRLGDRYAVHAGLAGRSGKALQGVSYIVDHTSERLACVMDVLFVHVNMETRRAAPLPDDVAETIDKRIAAHPWLADIDAGVTLRR